MVQEPRRKHLPVVFGDQSINGVFSQITDQPAKRPAKGPLAEGAKSRHLVLTLRLPAERQMQEATPWIQVALNLIDLMGKVSVKPEVRPTHADPLEQHALKRLTPIPQTTRKLRKIRADVDAELTKEYQREVAEETGETEEEKRLAKRRAEEKRRALLSPEEQKRVSLVHGRLPLAGRS